MTCTAQKVKPKLQQWTSTFPRELKTEVESTMFMKKLIAIAISNITYLRAIFPESAFGDRSLEDISLKILSDHNEFPGAMQLVNWVRGCFDALEKKYLRQLMIGVYTDESKPDHVIEAYTFLFTYNNQNTSVSCNGEQVASISMDCTSPDVTRKATLSLLRTIILLTQSLDPLPNNAFMVMKLLYYDDVTPPDYEPPGFKAADTDHFLYDNKPINVKVGTVATPFHSLKLRIKTNRKQFDCDEVPDSQDSVSMNGDVNNQDCAESDKSFSLDALNVREIPTITKESNTLPRRRGVNENTVTGKRREDTSIKEGKEEEESLSKKSHDQEEAECRKRKNKNLVRCPCGDHEDDGLMVQCSICFYWQHGACFALQSEDEAPELHVCEKCAISNDSKRKATDSYLTGLSQMDQQAVSIWRRVLVMCAEDSCSHITLSHLCKRLTIERKVAKSILKRLDDEGLVSSGPGKNSYRRVVNKTAIKDIAIPKYFEYGKSSQGSDIISGIMSEVPCVDSTTMSIDIKAMQTDEIEVITTKTKDMQVCSQTKDTSNQNSSQNKENRKRVAACISSKKKGQSFDVVSSQERLSESGQRQCKMFKVSRSKKNISV